MTNEELKQRLVELVTTTFECEETADCSQCKYNRSINCLVERTADNLIENGVTIQEHGGWELNKDGSATCKLCGKTQKNVWDFDNYQNFCGHCGADMRGVKDE